VSRVRPPIGGEFENMLRRLEGRVDSIARRNLSTLDVLVPQKHEEGSGFPGDWNTVYQSDAEDHAFSHLCRVGAPRLAYRFDLRTGNGALTAHARIVIVNDANPYTTPLPAWQVLAEVTSGSTTFVSRAANVAIPREVLDDPANQWNIAIHGRIPGGNGNEAGPDFWQVRPWAMILTSSAEFIPEKGNALV
jgi:hypothetical protein